MSIFYDPVQRRLRAAWRLILQAVFFFAPALLVGQVVIPQLSGVLSGSTRLLLSIVNHLLLLTFILGGCWLAARYFDRRPFRDFGFHFSRAWWRDLAFGLALGALLMVGIFLIELAKGWITVRGVMVAPGRGIPLAGALISGAIGYVFVGIYEELFSRGYQIRNLAEGLRWRFISPRAALLLAYILAALVFGLLHQGRENATPLITPILATIALFLGLGYLLSGELAMPIGIHITWNFFQGCVFGFPVSGSEFGASVVTINQGGPTLWTGGAWGPEGGALGLAALLLGVLAILTWVRLTRGAVRLQDRLAVYQPPTPEANGVASSPPAAHRLQPSTATEPGH